MRQSARGAGVGSGGELTWQRPGQDGPAAQGGDGELRAVGSAMVRVVRRGHGAWQRAGWTEAEASSDHAEARRSARVEVGDARRGWVLAVWGRDSAASLAAARASASGPPIGALQVASLAANRRLSSPHPTHLPRAPT